VHGHPALIRHEQDTKEEGSHGNVDPDRELSQDSEVLQEWMRDRRESTGDTGDGASTLSFAEKTSTTCLAKKAMIGTNNC
jgi:hypothetical protein